MGTNRRKPGPIERMGAPWGWLTGCGQMGDLVRQLDWSRTSLGPLEGWSQTLRSSINLVLGSPAPGVVLWGPDGVMIYNDAYARFAGQRHPRLFGSPVHEGWPEVADFNRRVLEVCLGGDTLSFHDEHFVLNRHGAPEDVWLDLHYSPIRDEAGNPVGVLAVVVETTDRVRAERQIRALNVILERQVHALAEVDREKTSFFTNISHEFRTPLTLMLGPTEDALHSPDLALSGDALETVHRNQLRLLKLVNSLLDLSRIDAGRMRPTFRPSDVGRLTADLAEGFRPAIERAGLTFRVNCDNARDVYVDHDMWETVVFNLLSNALKFTFDGSIEVAVRNLDDCVELRVADTGVGIAPDEQPRLFQRFHRVDRAPSRTHEGSGIGLALVHDFVELHAGSVRFESVPHQGTTFTVTLRRGAAHLPPDHVAPPDADAGAPLAHPTLIEEAARWTAAIGEPAARTARRSTLEPEAPLAAAPGRVLVVDDNADMRDYLARVLRAHWHTETANDGAHALALVRERVPDVIVTDVMMPNVDGFDLLQALRRSQATAHTPVIVVSARAGEEARLEGLQLGADDYLSKPFSARELVARVNVQMRLARLREASESANRAKDEFLAMLGHELRNPLAPILTALQLMKLRGASAVERERAVIERQAQHMVALVDDLLDVSRITRGKIDLRRADVEVSRFVAKAIEIASPLLEQQRHSLHVDVPSLGLIVHGDEGRLAQVVSNLLTNAAKYTEAGGRIAVTARAQDGRAIVRVSDNGTGIDPETLPKIFDLFVQERQAVDRSRGGLGLGLAIVRNLVALHGGSVHAFSRGKGQGSDLEIRLPLVDAVAEARPCVVEAPAVKTSGHSARVMIVDDNVEYATLLAEALTELGYSSRQAHDGVTALKAAEEFGPNVALIDIGLPVMDGYELAAHIRAHPQLATIRLIAISGYGQRQDLARSQEVGFVAHLVKPIDIDKLQDAIESCLPPKPEQATANTGSGQEYAGG